MAVAQALAAVCVQCVRIPSGQRQFPDCQRCLATRQSVTHPHLQLHPQPIPKST